LRFDLEKLKHPTVREEFQAKIGGKFAALNLIDADIDELSNNMGEAMITSEQEVLGRARHSKKPWVTNEVLDLCNERRRLRKSKHVDDATLEAYRTAHREVKKKMKEAKEEWIEQQCNEIDKGMKNNSKKAYKTLKALTKSNKSRTTAIENKNGKLLTDKNAIIERWSEYCQELYNHPIQPDARILKKQQKPPEEKLPILREKVEAAIKTLKSGKHLGQTTSQANC